MMSALSVFGFTAPWVLLAVLTLPILCWLLKISPPPPQRFVFPAIRLLAKERTPEQTPAKMPLWLLLLRLVLASLVILAMAGPLYHPLAQQSFSATGTLLVALEDDWAAAPDFSDKLASINAYLIATREAHHSCALALASEPATLPITPLPCDEVAARLARIEPVAYLPEPEALQQRLTNYLAKQKEGASPTASIKPQILFVTDGVEKAQSASFINWLEGVANQIPVHVLLPSRPIMTINAVSQSGQEVKQSSGQNTASAKGLAVQISRLSFAAANEAKDGDEKAPTNVSGFVIAKDNHGQVISQAPFHFDDASPKDTARLSNTSVTFDLPLELRNAISQISLANEASAGAVYLLDSRSSLQRVGLVVGDNDSAQPLLSSKLYLSKALADFASVIAPLGVEEQAIAQILAAKPNALVLADVANLSPKSVVALTGFLEQGGVVIRFAGTKLAAAKLAGVAANQRGRAATTDIRQGDALLPVRLRAGERKLGGALTWDKPKALAAFTPQSLFYGLSIPKDSVVRRQVLAEPDAGLADHTLAALEDGTPLVTAQRQGRGLLVLFHISADANWSNLPLSGLFVAMLQRLVLQGSSLGSSLGNINTDNQSNTDINNRQTQNRQALAPLASLSGYGVLGPPHNSAKALPSHYEAVTVDANHPPGLYGAPATHAVVALNALSNLPPLKAADFARGNIHSETLHDKGQRDLRAPILLAAFLCFLADCLLSYLLRFGGFAWLSRAFMLMQPQSQKSRPMRGHIFRGLSLLAFLSLSLAGGLYPSKSLKAEETTPASSPSSSPTLSTTQQNHDGDMARSVRLAYVPSGRRSVDETTLNGLKSLSRRVNERTALTLAEPVAVNPATDTLAFYPLLYWPVVDNADAPSDALVNHVAGFMRMGGTVLFDTKDAMQIAAKGGDLSSQGAGGNADISAAHPTPERLWLQVFLRRLDAPNLEPIPRDHVVTKTFYLLNNFIGRYSIGTPWIEALPPQDSNDTTPVPARAGDNVSPIIIVSNDLAAGWAENEAGQALYALDGSIARQHELAIRGGINLVMYTLTGNYKADQVHAKDLLERLGR